jgi:phospholipid/cholesterol/gamma-HCH transport system substrate-binding protein
MIASVGSATIECARGITGVLRTGKLDIKKDGYAIFVSFDDIAGLEKKAPVLLNGFTVGKVDDMKLSYGNERTRVTLMLTLDRGIKIREGAVVAIKTLGLMGEKFIKITSGAGPGFIRPGSTLEGKPFGDLDSLMEEAQGISKGIDELVGNLNSLSKDVQALTRNLNGTVEGNLDRITEILKNVEATTKNFEEFSQDIKAHPWKLLFKTKEKKQTK